MAYGWAGATPFRNAAEYDRSFARLCAGAVGPVLDALGAPSEPLLDAGCGTGTVAAAALARGWTVTAVDVEPTMTDWTREHVPGAEVATASLAALPHPPGAFAAIAANFALNHADHADACAAELFRVTAPGGRIAATVWPWQPTELNQMWAAIMDETGTRPERIEIPAGEPFPRTEEGLSGLLAGAGFAPVSAGRLTWEFAISPDDLWAGVEAGIATIGQAYTAADHIGRARIRAAYTARTRDSSILRFPVEAILAVGENSSR